MSTRFDPDFDHVFRVREDGTVADERGVYAPELLDDYLAPAWEFFSAGYSGQDRYSGPIMHNSEQFAGRLLEDVLATPGVYALVVSNYSPDETEGDDPDELYSEGWAVVRLRDEVPA